jgi:CRISPR/Cas system-associated endonuclease Cas1
MTQFVNPDNGVGAKTTYYKAHGENGMDVQDLPDRPRPGEDGCNATISIDNSA